MNFNLSVARNKAAQAEETSDLASDNERCGRKTKRKRFTSDSDSDSRPINTFTTFFQKKSIINYKENKENEESEESEENDKENKIANIPILKKPTKENSMASI